MLLLFSLASVAFGVTNIPCTTVNGGQCVISQAVQLSAGDNVCCDGIGSLTDMLIQANGSLSCPVGVLCGITITLSSGTFVADATQGDGSSPPPLVNISGIFKVAKANQVTFQGAKMFASSILTTTSDKLTCKASTLDTSATAGVCSPGTPIVFGISKLGPVVGLGAANAGAGATGYDSSPTSLAAAGSTYALSPFLLDTANPVYGCQGGAGDPEGYPCNGCAPPIVGRGGGAVKLVAESDLTFDGCTINADGGYGSRSGAGSGGSVVLVAGGSISVSGTVVSAHGGDAVTLSSDYPCALYPCGMPGGGGYVFAKSGNSGGTALASWANARGGVWKDAGAEYVCAGGGMLVDCQGGACLGPVGGAVTVSNGDAKCAASATGSSKACSDAPAYGPGPCLLSPTPLAWCTGTACASLTMDIGVNVTIPGKLALRVAGPLSAEKAVFSSAQESTDISSVGPMSLKDVSFVAPPGGTTRNLTVWTEPDQEPPSDLSWAISQTGADLSITGSLTVSAGGNLTLDFNDVYVATPAAKTADISCSSATWEGALLANAAEGDIVFGGSGINVGSLLLFAYNNIYLNGSPDVKARGCAASAGEGMGMASFLPGPSFLVVGGGASHSTLGSAGSAQPNAQNPPPGIAYDETPLTDKQLFGGSGGGGGVGAAGGKGGGTVLLVGNGTVYCGTPSFTGACGTTTFDVSGDAGQTNATGGTGGGGSGGMVVLAFNSYNKDGNDESAAMHSVTVTATGGKGGYLGDSPNPGQLLCGGSGGGGTVLLAVPGAVGIPATKKPKIDIGGGGSPHPSCSPGAAGTTVYTNLPTPPSTSRTPSISLTPSITSSGSPSSSQTPSLTPSVSPTPSGSDTVSPTPSGSDTVTPTATSSVSGTLTQTPSNTATSSPSPTYVPPGPPTMFGVNTASFYAAVGGGVGLVVCAIGFGVARALRKADPSSLSDVGGGPSGSLWNDAYAEKASLLRTPEPGGARAASGYLSSGGSFYVPPAGVV